MKNIYVSPEVEICTITAERLLGTASLEILEGETGTNNGGADEITDQGFKGLSRKHHDVWEDEEEEEDY